MLVQKARCSTIEVLTKLVTELFKNKYGCLMKNVKDNTPKIKVIYIRHGEKICMRHFLLMKNVQMQLIL